MLFSPIRENSGKLLGYQFIIWLNWNLIGSNKNTSILDIAIGPGTGRSAVMVPPLRRKMYQEVIDSIINEGKMQLATVN